MYLSQVPTLSDCLGHMLEAIRRINQYTGSLTEGGFLENHLVQDAVTRNLKVISESVRILDEHHLEFRLKHAEALCISANKLGSVFSCSHLKIDLGIVWQTIQTHLPEFARQVQLLTDSEEVCNAGT